MIIIVKQGQRVDLTTKEIELSRIMVGLGWDPSPASRCTRNQDPASENLSDDGEFHAADCDASVLMLNAENKLRSKQDIIYYHNLKSRCGSIQHMGDNRTGGEGDNEQILIDLNLVPSAIHKLLFVVTIYECEQRKQDFSLIQNAFIRIVNLAKYQELMRFNLTDPYVCKTALIVGEIYRYQQEWKFGAIGEGTNDTSLFQIAKRFT